MDPVESLLATNRPFLADGGLETWLFFLQGFEAPEFAAIALMRDETAREAMARYFAGFLDMAERAKTGFVLDTVTWRGCVAWAPKLGLAREDLLRLSAEAVRFAQALRDEWRSRLPAIIVNGVVGPAGDAYRPDAWPSGDEALALHAPQVGVLAEAGVDMISALTMTNAEEAIGIARAAQAAGLPSVISFTVETDGTLPSRQPLGAAIAAVDAATARAPAFYMVNCAHPDHFRDCLASGADWVERIGGLRANASRLSHAELDVAEVLDDGDPQEFGQLHGDLARLLPGLRVAGGCCGTDHRHVAHVSQHLHGEAVG